MQLRGLFFLAVNLVVDGIKNARSPWRSVARCASGRSCDLPIAKGLHAWHIDADLRQQRRKATTGGRIDF